MLKIICAIFVIIFCFSLILSPTYNFNYSYIGALTYVPTTLRGQIQYSDLGQDIIGLRALLRGQNPYPILSEAASSIGIVEWKANHRSTHPPTAFLLTLPVFSFPWPFASGIWGWVMIIMTVISLLLFNLRWEIAIIFTIISLFWPPMIFSLGQFTAIWLLCYAMAYHFRDRSPFFSGFLIGISSFTKFFPAVMLAPFLFRRKWFALVGFCVAWLIIVIILFSVSSTWLSDYWKIIKIDSIFQVTRADNGSVLGLIYKYFGTLGGILVVFVLLGLGLICLWINAKKPISFQEWGLFIFISIAILPVAWMYTLLPLLPVLLWGINQRGKTMKLALLIIFIPILLIPIKVTNSLSVAVMICLGLLLCFPLILNKSKSNLSENGI